MKFKGLTSLLYICSMVGLGLNQNVQAFNIDPQAPEVAANAANKNVNKHMAKEELRGLLALFSNMSATFTQQIFDLQGEALQSSQGDIILQKPQMLRWSVNSPEESLLIADGNTVYSVDPFVEQVTLMEQSSLTKTNPLMLLISNQKSQWDNVEIEKIDGDFVVRSLDQDASITLVILSFNNSSELTLLTSIDRQQQRNIIEFSNVKMNIEVPANSFNYTPESTWVVDDQRLSQ